MKLHKVVIEMISGDDILSDMQMLPKKKLQKSKGWKAKTLRKIICILQKTEEKERKKQTNKGKK